MAYGVLDGDAWDGYCVSAYGIPSAYGYLPKEYCEGDGYGLLVRLLSATSSTLAHTGP